MRGFSGHRKHSRQSVILVLTSYLHGIMIVLGAEPLNLLILAQSLLLEQRSLFLLYPSSPDGFYKSKGAKYDKAEHNYKVEDFEQVLLNLVFAS